MRTTCLLYIVALEIVNRKMRNTIGNQTYSSGTASSISFMSLHKIVFVLGAMLIFAGATDAQKVSLSFDEKNKVTIARDFG